MMTQIRPDEFAAWLAQADAQPVMLDVREPWEWRTASVTVEGFTLLQIPMQSIPARLAELKLNHSADYPLACLCHHGVRSLQVVNYLAQNGFTNVVNVQGGIAAWAQQVDNSIAQY